MPPATPALILSWTRARKMAVPVVALSEVESRTPVIEKESRPGELRKAGALKSPFVSKLFELQPEAHSRIASPAN